MIIYQVRFYKLYSIPNLYDENGWLKLTLIQRKINCKPLLDVPATLLVAAYVT